MKNIHVKIIQIALNNAQRCRDLGRDEDAVQQLITAVRAILHSQLEEEYHRYVDEEEGGYNYQSWLHYEKNLSREAAAKIAR